MATIVCACIFGICVFSTVRMRFMKKKHRQKIKALSNASGWHSDKDRIPDHSRSLLDEKVIELMEYVSSYLSLGKKNCSLPSSLIRKKDVEKALLHSGLNLNISVSGFYQSKLILAVALCAIGALFGAVFSGTLSLILAVTGAFAGWRLPSFVVSRQTKWRVQQMEKHLPEMLNVIVLGMRSGLAFDASLRLYVSHFKTMLAAEFANAQQKWDAGLESRGAALRAISESYDSAVFNRVIETIIRSLRFGSSMVDSLESQSLEARAIYKTRREEQVAKAPVKMMIPTGTLILPAMLILVLGPVLLELVEGGF